MSKPAFIITMDAEGDNLWAVPDKVTTRNVSYLPRFQSLCEKYGLRPTWLTNHEMATCASYGEFAQDMLRRGSGEVGMHLHAWDSPPIRAKAPDGQAYLIEFDEHAMREKIALLTEVIETRIGTRAVSHRAGRWAFDSRYARALVDYGYRIDCSVTPHVSWAQYLGDPCGAGGTDYRGFPEQPYFMDLDRIDQPGDSCLLEVPMSICWRDGHLAWLRPDGENLDDMLAILNLALEKQRHCVTFMLHSSELMPGGSPNFTSEDGIEELYDDLEALFSFAADHFRGATLTEFRDGFVTG